jgi:EmrB/QacA subfamily drug resistance transporter
MPSDGNSAHRLRWLILGALLIGTATGTLGNSLVNVALPTIMDHFSVDVGTGIWAVTIYILLFAVTMPLFGRLGDMYGYKRAYLIGISVFALGSLLAPLARGFPALIALRAVQGVGNGPILPAIMAVIGTLFPPGERGRAMGAWALVNSGFHAAGPPLGGILTQYFGWQSIFVSYVPLCFLAVFLVWRLMPDDSKSQRQPFDMIGAITLTSATLTLMFNLRQGAYLGWTSSASLLLWAVCLALFAAFVVTERRVRQPFVDLNLFANRPYTAASTIAFIQAFCQFGLLFLIPLFLIEVQGYPAAQTGLILASLPITMAIAAPVAGRLADRYGCRLLCLSGMTVVTLAGLALSLLGPATPLWYILGSLALAGIGMGMVQSPAPAAISLVVLPGTLGIAMGLFNLLRFLGGTLGPTIFALVLQTVGAGFAPESFRTVFYLVTTMAIVAVMVGLFAPGVEAPHSSLAEEQAQG